MIKSLRLQWFINLGIAISFALIGWFLWKHADDLHTIDWHAIALPFILGLLLYGLALGIQGVVWVAIFTSLNNRKWNKDDIKIYFLTHLMRRLPGAPWYMAGRVAMYSEQNSNVVRVVWIVNLLEWGGVILSGLVWIAWGYWGWPGLLSILIAIIIIIQLLLQNLITRNLPLNHRFSSKIFYYAFLAYEILWFLAALILYFLLSAIASNYMLNFLEIGTLWAISGVVSTLAIFAPMGLGIRELSLVTLLTPRVGLGSAVLTALLMRILFTVGDVLWSVIVIGVITLKIKFSTSYFTQRS